jgi:hypothetical protein
LELLTELAARDRDRRMAIPAEKPILFPFCHSFLDELSRH